MAGNALVQIERLHARGAARGQIIGVEVEDARPRSVRRALIVAAAGLDPLAKRRIGPDLASPDFRHAREELRDLGLDLALHRGEALFELALALGLEPGAGAHIIEELVQRALEADLLPHFLELLVNPTRINKQFEEVRRRSLQGLAAPVLRLYAHRSAVPPQEQGASSNRASPRQGKVDAKVPQFFSKLPKTGLVILPYPPYARSSRPAAATSRDARRRAARHLLFNTYDLPSRSTWDETTLFLHEGEPGHHFQISLAQENARCRRSCASAATPPMSKAGRSMPRRWATMGMYNDPYQRFGDLNDEMLRAMRLVVDTGIHAKGWTREQAIEYMLANSRHERRPTPPPRSSATSPFPARRPPTRSAS